MSHFTVLVVGSQFGWEEVDELLFPYWLYPNVLSQEQLRADPRFVFEKENPEESFEEWKLRNPKHINYYKDAQEYANQNLCFEKDLGWGYWINHQSKGYKWDWYRIGGRWSDFFILKQGAEGLVGSPPLCTESPTDLRAADQARKCDIDWEAMQERGRREAEKKWELAMQKAYPYREQWGYGLYPTDTKQSFTAREGRLAGTTFAVLMDGNWVERVEGGWTPEGPSEKSMSEWHQKFMSLLEKIPNDAVLTLVDCHT